MDTVTTETTKTTDIALLPPDGRARIALGSTKTEADLKAMVEETSYITEIKDKAGREQAHTAGMKLKNARIAVEKTGKDARDDANAFSKAVIAEEKRLIAITEPEEKRVFGLRDAYDKKIEEEKRAAQARILSIRNKIEGIRQIPMTMFGASSERIAEEIQLLSAVVPTAAELDGMVEECSAAISTALKQLRDLHDKTLAQEQAAAVIEAQRIALEQENKRISREEAGKLAWNKVFEEALIRPEAEAPKAAIVAEPQPARNDTTPAAFVQQFATAKNSNPVDPVKAALAKAVSAICSDNSDNFERALWDIVKILGGYQALGLLQSNSAAAYEKYVEGIN